MFQFRSSRERAGNDVAYVGIGRAGFTASFRPIFTPGLSTDRPTSSSTAPVTNPDLANLSPLGACQLTGRAFGLFA